MNSSKILFLKMLRSDIKRATYAKMGISSDDSSSDELLAGQTIDKDTIESFSSFRLMNAEERSIVNSILETVKKKDASDDMVSNERSMDELGKLQMQQSRVKSMQYESLIPRSYEGEYKDAA